MSETMQRDLYLNSVITRESVFELIQGIEAINKEDDEFDQQIIAQVNSLIAMGVINTEEISLPKRSPIRIHINSEGGELSAGFSLITAIENSLTPVIGYVDGWCMSMAVPILAVCDLRLCSRFAEFMIHDVSGGVVGKSNEIVVYAKNTLPIIKKNYISVMEEYTKLTPDQMDEIMDRNHDYFFFPEEAKEYGLVDYIDTEEMDEEKVLKALYYSDEEEDSGALKEVEEMVKDTVTEKEIILPKVKKEDKETTEPRKRLFGGENL